MTVGLTADRAAARGARTCRTGALRRMASAHGLLQRRRHHARRADRAPRRTPARPDVPRTSSSRLCPTTSAPCCRARASGGELRGLLLDRDHPARPKRWSSAACCFALFAAAGPLRGEVFAAPDELLALLPEPPPIERAAAGEPRPPSARQRSCLQPVLLSPARWCAVAADLEAEVRRVVRGAGRLGVGRALDVPAPPGLGGRPAGAPGRRRAGAWAVAGAAARRSAGARRPPVARVPARPRLVGARRSARAFRAEPTAAGASPTRCALRQALVDGRPGAARRRLDCAGRVFATGCSAPGRRWCASSSTRAGWCCFESRDLGRPRAAAAAVRGARAAVLAGCRGAPAADGSAHRPARRRAQPRPSRGRAPGRARPSWSRRRAPTWARCSTPSATWSCASAAARRATTWCSRTSRPRWAAAARSPTAGGCWAG